MMKSISASELRHQIKHVLNEVGYSRSIYLVEKFGEPIAAIISVEDFQLLQHIKQQQEGVNSEEAAPSFQAKLAAIHQDLRASGYQSRSKEEVDAQIEAERESWGG